MKMSRQFYRTDYRSVLPQRGSTSSTGGFAGKCLEFGMVGHKVAQCPQRNHENASAAEPREEAPFVCFSEDRDAANVVKEGVTSEQAMLQSKAILDGGATRTPRISSGSRASDGTQSAASGRHRSPSCR